MPKRIFFILDNYWGQCRGGAELQAHFLEKAALSRGWKVHYFFLSDGTAYDTGTATRFVPARRQKIWTRFNDIKYPYAAALLSALKQAAPDAVYQRCAMSLTGIAAWYARQAGIPLFFHIASDRDVRPPAWPITRPLLLPEYGLARYGIKNAHAVIAQTHSQAAALKRMYRKTAVVIPNGHPVPPRHPKPDFPLTILWVGNWKAVKQPEVFVALAKQIRRSANIRVIMAGKVGSYGALAGQARKSGIEVTGEMSNDQVNALFEKSHLLVNTSWHEGFSNTFIQAWLRQVPVMSLNADPDNLMNRYGLGCCISSCPGLVRAIRHLLDDPQKRTRMGGRARQYAETHFSTRNMDRILDLISNDC